MICKDCDKKLIWELEADKDNNVYQKTYCADCGILYYRDLEIVDDRKKE